MQRLLVYQALWGMEQLEGVDLEHRLEAAIERIFTAGFEGIGVSLLNEQRAVQAARAAHDRNGSVEAIGFVRNADDLAVMIDRALRIGAHHLNVQIMPRLDTLSDAVALFTQFAAQTAKFSLPVNYETHRGRLTNDLLFVTRLLDELPDLRLTGDLSHYVVAHEMPLPVPPAELARITKVIDHCWGFHGRVSGSHQVQVALSAPQHAGWLQQFSAWWREGFTSWRLRADADAHLSFMAELGPPHYAITDARGRELSDRWAEALQLKQLARDLWAETASATQANSHNSVS